MKPKKRTKLNPLSQFGDTTLNPNVDEFEKVSPTRSLEKKPHVRELAFHNLMKLLVKGTYSMNLKTFSNKEEKLIEDNVQVLFGSTHVIWLESTENRSVNDRGELNIYDDDIDRKNDISLSPVRTITIGCIEDLEKIKSFPYVYINYISIFEGLETSYTDKNGVTEQSWTDKAGITHHSHLEISYMECNLRKKKVTFTISEELMDNFTMIADKLAINKSKFVENKIKEVIESYKG
jgi:hypothetical protein